MNAVWQWIVSLYALMAAYPFLAFLLCWLLFYWIFREQKKSIQISMDITTFFLIGSVSVMYNRLVPSGIGGFWLIVLILLIIAGLLGNAQNRMRGEVDVQRLARAVWRIGFLMLSFLYIVFLIIGITKSILSV